MAELKDEPGFKPANPAAPEGPGPGTGPGPGPGPGPFTLNPLPGINLPPTGKARWDELLAANGWAAPSMGTEGFDKWVMGLQADPSDPEFAAIVRREQDRVRRKQEEERRRQEELERKRATAAAGKGRVPQGGQKAAERSIESDAEFDDRDRFIGGSAGEYDATNKDNDPGPSQQQLDQWVKDKQIALEGPVGERKRASGEYVYVGTEKSTRGKETRDVWMDADTAKATIADLPEAEIRSYQKALGLPETGKIDQSLRSIWNDAVEQAQIYASRGHKVTVKELFLIQVRAYAAQRAQRGGGGRGGASAEATDPEDMAADYYMAMLQILGDISGVQS